MSSRWRPTPRRMVQLLVGLWLFGTGEGLLVVARLGNSPWTVLAEGVSEQTPLSIGAATIVLSGVVLLVWIPLRQAPGLGTLLNAVLVGVALDVTLEALGFATAGAVRALAVVGGVGLVAAGSGLYLASAFGPGPRDGLMTGLHRRTGRPVALVRAALELSVLVAGVALGGTAGVGTLAFALLIGPAVAVALRTMGVTRAGEL